MCSWVFSFLKRSKEAELMKSYFQNRITAAIFLGIFLFNVIICQATGVLKNRLILYDFDKEKYILQKQ